MSGQAIVNIRDKQWNVSLATTYSELVAGLGGISSIPMGTGMLFDMGLYQHVGGLFSPADDGLKVKDRAALENLRALLKKAKRESGLVAPSFGYLNADLTMYERMSWKCSADRDTFLVVNNDGRLMACQEHLTDVDVRSIASLSDPAWRKAKREKVEACRGCFYGCYYQKENVRFADALYGLYTLLMI